MKLVHWPFIGRLLHLVKRGRACAGPQPAQAPLITLITLRLRIWIFNGYNCVIIKTPLAKVAALRNVLLSVCLSVRLFVPLSAVKFMKSFATWQHLAASRGLPYLLLRHTCSLIFTARCYAVMWCLPVSLSATFVYCIKMSYHICNFFHHRVATPFWFSKPNIMAIFRREPVNCGNKSRFFDQYLVLESMTGGASSTISTVE